MEQRRPASRCPATPHDMRGSLLSVLRDSVRAMDATLANGTVREQRRPSHGAADRRSEQVSRTLAALGIGRRDSPVPDETRTTPFTRMNAGSRQDGLWASQLAGRLLDACVVASAGDSTALSATVKDVALLLRRGGVIGSALKSGRLGCEALASCAFSGSLRPLMLDLFDAQESVLTAPDGYGAGIFRLGPVLRRVAGFLAPRSWARLSSTCTRFRRVCRSNPMWDILLRRDFAGDSQPVMVESAADGGPPGRLAPGTDAPSPRRQLATGLTGRASPQGRLAALAERAETLRRRRGQEARAPKRPRPAVQACGCAATTPRLERSVLGQLYARGRPAVGSAARRMPPAIEPTAAGQTAAPRRSGAAAGGSIGSGDCRVPGWHLRRRHAAPRPLRQPGEPAAAAYCRHWTEWDRHRRRLLQSPLSPCSECGETAADLEWVQRGLAFGQFRRCLSCGFTEVVSLGRPDTKMFAGAFMGGV